MTISRVDVNDLLSQMREMQWKAQGGNAVNGGPGAIDGIGNSRPVEAPKESGFGDILKNAVDGVHKTQQASSRVTTAYEMGDPTVSLSQVMVAQQKASVSMQGLTQVRNKVVEAYKDIMNMPI